MASPLGDFLRGRRDATRPDAVGLRDAGSRRRAPGLRRSELATLAGISVEYLVRIEQGRDRNPSASVLNALADALHLDAAERDHLRRLTKMTGGTCVGARAQAGQIVRPGVQRLVDGFEPGIAVLTNRLGDLLSYTRGFESIARLTGWLDADPPNLTRFVFTDPRARQVFPQWDQIADQQAFNLSCSPADGPAATLRADLSKACGDDFVDRLARHRLPTDGAVHLDLPGVGPTQWDRETLELPASDAQQLTVFFPADVATREALSQIMNVGPTTLRAVR